MASVDALSPPAAEPTHRRWTKEEFYRMGELGWFEGQRAELVDGEIVVLSTQNFPNALTTDRIASALRTLFGPSYWVRMQLPLDTGRTSLPEPDVSVVIGPAGRYKDHPTDALLVVEISDTTLRFDRGRNGTHYAAAGVPDYWIVNLDQRQLEVYRDPQPDPSKPGRWRYQTQNTLSPPDTISPLQLPTATVTVASLLPPP
jgi:Uma2 family endonuclease